MGFEPTLPKEPDLKSGALDHSAIGVIYNFIKILHRVGFEPTLPKEPDLKSGALDHSAIDVTCNLKYIARGRVRTCDRQLIRLAL